MGELARQLFPGGVDCTPKSYFNFQEAVIRTKKEIEKGTKIIYEAAFQYNGVLASKCNSFCVLISVNICLDKNAF